VGQINKNCLRPKSAPSLIGGPLRPHKHSVNLNYFAN